MDLINSEHSMKGLKLPLLPKQPQFPRGTTVYMYTIYKNQLNKFKTPGREATKA